MVEALHTAFPGAGSFLADDPSGAFIITDHDVQVEIDDMIARATKLDKPPAEVPTPESA